MSEGQKLAGFPRPGPALKLVLILLVAFSLFTTAVDNWHAPGGEVLTLLPMTSDALSHFQLWRLATSGLLTAGLSHLFYSLLGLYFLTPELEKTMGRWRLLRFLLIAVVSGNVMSLLADAIMPAQYMLFHPAVMFGPTAMISATAIAWAKANERNTVRMFFILPVTGRQFFYATIGFCILGVIYHEAVPEGVLAPFGGVLTGMLFAGQPSRARAAYLRMKLFFLRRKKGHVSVESLLRDPSGGKSRAARKGGPELRVVLGGLEDKLKDPPKDKRYLN